MGNSGFLPNQGNRGPPTRRSTQDNSPGNRHNGQNPGRSHAALRSNLQNMSANSQAREISRRIAAARASGEIPQNAHAIPIRIPRRVAAQVNQRGGGRPTWASLGDALLSHVEEAQMEYALALSRQDFEREPQGTPPTEEKYLALLKEECLDLTDIEDSNEQCVICCETQRAGDLAVKLPCGHAFHKRCITPWLQKNSTCPVCRLDINDHFSKVEEESKKQPVDAFKQNLEDKKRKHGEELEQRKKLLEELSEVEENERKSKPIEQWSISFLKVMLRKLGLEEVSKTALEKSTLVELVKSARDKQQVMALEEDEIKRRLQHLGEDTTSLTSKDQLIDSLVSSVQKLLTPS